MSCGMPVPPVNGSIVGQDFSLGARATYQCNPGFRLAGPVTTSVICQESGRWSPIEAPPRCIREYFSSSVSWFSCSICELTLKLCPFKKKLKNCKKFQISLAGLMLQQNQTWVDVSVELVYPLTFQRWPVPTLATPLWNMGDGGWYMELKTNMTL